MMIRSSETNGLLFEVGQVDFLVNLPDGSTRSATLSAEEARDFVGTKSQYSMFWWVRAAEHKLGIDQFLASLVSSSSFHVGSSCKMYQESGANPRFEVTYGYPEASPIAAV